jgi:hypothetical protein
MNDEIPDIDWAALHARIMAAAASRLERMRGAYDAWWTYAAAWARPGLPIGLAAGILIVLGVASLPTSTTPVVIEEVLVSAAEEALPAGAFLSADVVPSME